MHNFKVLKDRPVKDNTIFIFNFGTLKPVVFIGSASLVHVIDVLFFLHKQVNLIEEKVSRQYAICFSQWFAVQELSDLLSCVQICKTTILNDAMVNFVKLLPQSFDLQDHEV